MPFADGFMFVPSSALTWVTGFIVLTVFLYFARQPAHDALRSLSRALYHSMRLGASSLLRAADKLGLRNREVLLADGRAVCERMIEREFERVGAAMHRDLAECPSLHRKMKEEITHIEEDHRQSTDLPPAPPSWVKAVTAVSKIPTRGDPMVANILENIQASLVKDQDKAIEEYRAARQARHRHLRNMMPHWRELLQLVNVADKNINSLLQRAQVIDRQIGDYEDIVKETDGAVRRLSSSSLVQFFVSAFVLVIAVGGAVINFHLIARPMAEMVGGNSMIGSFKISDIAALVIILVEISMGLFLMESLRITRLFPVIGALPDRMRILMIWITFAILFVLACVESGLAYMREILLQDSLATSALLRGEGAAVFDSGFVWITTAAQMGMGFILPFALVFVAIPLETFIHSLRTVLGLTGTAALRCLAVLLRLLGSVFRYIGEMLVGLYDVAIFAPLWLEKQIKVRTGTVRQGVGAATVREPS